MSPPGTEVAEEPVAPVAQPAASVAPTAAAPQAEPVAAPVAPIALTAPEGAQVDPSYLALVTERAKSLGLDGTGAQKMLEAELAHKTQQVAAWGAEIQADPEFAGGKLEEARQHARLAVERIWGAPFLDVLDKSGLGNYPAFFKGLAKFGKTLGEPNAPTIGAPTKRTRKFPNSTSMYKDSE